MKATIYITSIYWNKALATHFFTSQAYRTLEKFVESVEDYNTDDTLQIIDDFCEQLDFDIDQMNDIFHNEDLATIADIFGLNLKQE